MKTKRRGTMMVALGIALAALPLAGSAALLHTFDTVGYLADHFNATAGPDTLAEAEDGGINNTRAVRGTTSSAAATRVEKLGFTGDTPEFTISFLFKPRAPTVRTAFPWALGILRNNTDSARTNAHTTNLDYSQLFFGLIATGASDEWNVVSLRYYNMRNGVSSGATDSYKWAFTAGEWYQLRADFSVNENDGYDVTYGIYNASSDGTVGSVIRAVTVNNLYNPEMLNDPEVHAFMYTNASAWQRGVDRIDNFASPVPEPGTLLLTGFGLAALRLFRRRRA